MKNMKFSEFLDLLYGEQEIEFAYKDHIYYFEISSKDLSPQEPLEVNIYEMFNDKESICICKFLYNKSTYAQDIDRLLESPIFNDKSLSEIEKEVTVLSNS